LKQRHCNTKQCETIQPQNNEHAPSTSRNSKQQTISTTRKSFHQYCEREQEQNNTDLGSSIQRRKDSLMFKTQERKGSSQDYHTEKETIAFHNTHMLYIVLIFKQHKYIDRQRGKVKFHHI